MEEITWWNIVKGIEFCYLLLIQLLIIFYLFIKVCIIMQFYLSGMSIVSLYHDISHIIDLTWIFVIQLTQ